MAKRAFIRSGELKHLIVVEEPVATNDAVTNEQVITWTQRCRAYAAVEDKKDSSYGREFYENSQFHGRTLTSFTCRKVEVRTVNETMRVAYDGATYNILAIRQDHADQQYTVLETERTT
jgi:head-tail adaptor